MLFLFSCSLSDVMMMIRLSKLLDGWKRTFDSGAVASRSHCQRPGSSVWVSVMIFPIWFGVSACTKKNLCPSLLADMADWISHCRTSVEDALSHDLSSIGIFPWNRKCCLWRHLPQTQVEFIFLRSFPCWGYWWKYRKRSLPSWLIDMWTQIFSFSQQVRLPLQVVFQKITNWGQHFFFDLSVCKSSILLFCSPIETKKRFFDRSSSMKRTLTQEILHPHPPHPHFFKEFFSDCRIILSVLSSIIHCSSFVICSLFNDFCCQSIGFNRMAHHSSKFDQNSSARFLKR